MRSSSAASIAHSRSWRAFYSDGQRRGGQRGLKGAERGEKGWNNGILKAIQLHPTSYIQTLDPARKQGGDLSMTDLSVCLLTFGGVYTRPVLAVKYPGTLVREQ